MDLVTATHVVSTELGIVGGSHVMTVSTAGGLLVDTPVGPVTLDWWVGAEDRWHVASHEAAVRQAEGDDGATVETRLRVPGGDVVHRVAAVPSGGRVLARVEIANATPVPVAVAVVVVLPDGARRIEACDDTILVDGWAVLRAARSIARFHVGATIEEALADVDAGAALAPLELAQPIVGAVAVAIFPLPHTAVLACAVAADRGESGRAFADALDPTPTTTHLRPGGLPAPSALPPFDAVARGWNAHMAAAATISVPDDRLMRIVEMSRRHLLSGVAIAVDAAFWTESEPWAAPVAAVALDAWGHDGEALDLLLAATGPDDLAVHAARSTIEAGALAWAWAERLERRPDPSLAATIAPFVEQLAVRLLQPRRGFRLRRSPLVDTAPAAAAWRAVSLAAASSVLSRAGDRTAGADIVDALPQLAAALATGDDGHGGASWSDVMASPALVVALGGRRVGLADNQIEDLAELLSGATNGGASPDPLARVAARASVTGAFGGDHRGHDPAMSALILLAVRRALLDEPFGAGGTVALMSSPEKAWLGGSIEAHAVPIAGGTASFALRWHGTRPALLWELDVAGPAPDLTAPGLDPSWSHSPELDDKRPSGSVTGEALLAVTPGLVTEAMESPLERRGEVIDPDDAPGSFA